MLKFLTFALLFLTGTLTFLAQQPIDKKSFNTAIKTIQKESRVPLRLPTFFPVPSYLSAKERKMPLKVSCAATTDSFAIEYCYSGVCFGSYFYGEISGEKITAHTEKPAFDKTVKLAKGIKGYYQEASCGSSCGHAWMFWEQDGFLYSVGLQVDDDRKTLTKVANSAINNNKYIEPQKSQDGVLNSPAQSVQTESFESVEAFLKSTLKSKDKLEFEAKGDLNGDGLADWAGVIKREKEEPFIANGIKTDRTGQLYVLLRQRPGGYRIAEKSKESGIFRVGDFYLASLEIKGSSLFLVADGKEEVTTGQIRLYKGEGRLIGWQTYYLQSGHKSIETDRNLLTGAVVEKRKNGNRKPIIKRYQMRFSKYFLKDFILLDPNDIK